MSEPVEIFADGWNRFEAAYAAMPWWRRLYVRFLLWRAWRKARV